RKNELPVRDEHAESRHRQIDVRSDRSMPHDLLPASISQIGIQIDCVPLAEAVDERQNSANPHADASAEHLPAPGFFHHDICRSPPDAADAQKEQQVSPPSDRLPHATAQLLVIAAEEVAAGCLRERRNGRDQYNGDESQRRLNRSNKNGEVNERAARPRKSRTFKQVAIHFANTGIQTSPSQALHMLCSLSIC